MNTPVKRTKSTALGKKCNPSRGPTKHGKGHFPPKRCYRVPKKDFLNMILEFTYGF